MHSVKRGLYYTAGSLSNATRHPGLYLFGEQMALVGMGARIRWRAAARPK
jgi:hypothetical protein